MKPELDKKPNVPIIEKQVVNEKALSSEIMSPGKLVWRRFKKNKLALIGMFMLSIMIFLALAAPLLSGYAPTDIEMGNFRGEPDDEHLLGTDSLGRDIWTRLLYGARISMTVGLVSVSISILVGVTIGALAGYYGGMVDNVLMRITEIFMSFPFLLFALTLLAVLEGKGGIYTVMVVIGILGWMGTARLVRGEFLSLREREFVKAARALGVSDIRLIFKHMLPNAFAPVVVSATLGVASAILMESALSFIGIGISPENPTWGNMLSEAQSRLVLARMPWMWIPPGIAILFAVLSINFVGDGLRDALDPRLKE